MTEDKISMYVVAGDEVKKTISIVRKQYLILVTLGLIYNLFSITLSIYRYHKYSDKIYQKLENTIMVKVLPLVSIMHTIIIVIAYVMYYKAIKMQRDAAFSGDQLRYNRSFELNRKANYLTIITVCISFISLLFYFFIEIVRTPA